MQTPKDEGLVNLERDLNEFKEISAVPSGITIFLDQLGYHVENVVMSNDAFICDRDDDQSNLRKVAIDKVAKLNTNFKLLGKLIGQRCWYFLSCCHVQFYIHLRDIQHALKIIFSVFFLNQLKFRRTRKFTFPIRQRLQNLSQRLTIPRLVKIMPYY